MLDWFTTIPGILVICGIVLLVIAIILFILGAKKTKKEGAVNNVDVGINQPVMNQVANPVPIQPVESNDLNNQVVSEPVAVSEPVQSNVYTQPTISNQGNIYTRPAVSNQGNAYTQPVVSNQGNIYTQPSVSNQGNVYTQPAVSNQSSNYEEVNVLNTDIPNTSSDTTLDNPTIYGGKTPSVDFSINNEKPVTIYGGNDPLEATQTLPKVDVHHEPYGGVSPEVKITETKEIEKIPTPVEETISTIPEVGIVSNPSVETPSFDYKPLNSAPSEEVASIENNGMVLEEKEESSSQIPQVAPIIIPDDEEPILEEL